MDMLGQGQEPTFLDWTGQELVGLNGEGLTVSVTHSRGSRQMGIKMVLSTLVYTFRTTVTALSISTLADNS